MPPEAPSTATLKLRFCWTAKRDRERLSCIMLSIGRGLEHKICPESFGGPLSRKIAVHVNNNDRQRAGENE